MPQREFWSSAIPTKVIWTYQVDHTNESKPGHLTMTVYDQGGEMMEHSSSVVLDQLVHEQVGTALCESWEAWLFGDRHAGPRALKLVEQRFRAQARRLRSVRL